MHFLCLGRRVSRARDRVLSLCQQLELQAGRQFGARGSFCYCPCIHCSLRFCRGFAFSFWTFDLGVPAAAVSLLSLYLL